MGDFNYEGINWETGETSNKAEEEFMDVISDCYLEQHVRVPTVESNILDLILTTESNMVEEVLISSPISNCDHGVLNFKVICSM